MDKVSWNELDINECFLCGSCMYKKISKNKAFFFNGHTEIDVDVEENKDNKVFTRTDK